MLRLYVSVIITFVLETEPEQIILRSDDVWYDDVSLHGFYLCFSSATILKKPDPLKQKSLRANQNIMYTIYSWPRCLQQIKNIIGLIVFRYFTRIFCALQ